jgi:integrase
MASIKVMLYTSKILSNGEHPIMLRVIKDRKPKYISLNLSCSKSLWNDKENIPSKKHPLYNSIVNKINKKKLEASKLIIGLETDDLELSAEQIQLKLKAEIKNKVSVFNYFNETIEKLEKSNRIGYANIFKSTKNSFMKFRNNKDLNFLDITPSLILKYEEWFYERDVKMNSVFVFLRTFKTLINNAKKEGITKTDFNPFKDISFTKFRRIKTSKRAISKDEIISISKLDIKEGTALSDARNYFLFSYYSRGINFIDMANLKWSNIANNRLIYERKKTKELLSIGLLDPAKLILDYYEKFKEKESGFIFPILSDKYNTAKSIDNRIDKMLKIVNSNLKIIGSQAGIKEKLTTYVARHSYATVMKKSGVPTAIISEALGHESEKTTQIYLDSFENIVIDEASKSIL